jgi:hypothetical protein
MVSNNNVVPEENIIEDKEGLISDLKKDRADLFESLRYETDFADKAALRSSIYEINNQLIALQGHV